MKLKKIAALFMAMVMVVGATACGGNSDAQSASGDGEAAESTEESGGDGEVKPWIIYNQAELTVVILPLDAKHRIFTPRPQRPRSLY